MSPAVVFSDPKDPSHSQVKVRAPQRSHEFVIPSNFATIPTSATQHCLLRNANNHHHRRKFSLPPSIREEENEEDDNLPEAALEGEDEDVPLAMLAYRKGFVIPKRKQNIYPLAQYIPSNYYQDSSYIQPYIYHPLLHPNSLMAHQFYGFTQQIPTNSHSLKNNCSFYQTQLNNGSYSSLSSASLSSNSSSSSSDACPSSPSRFYHHSKPPHN